MGEKDNLINDKGYIIDEKNNLNKDNKNKLLNGKTN